MSKTGSSLTLRWLKVTPVVFAGFLGLNVASAAAQSAAAGKMPDAQVEANVLKGLAGAPDLANQAITTNTVYGVVTLSGSVATEPMRVEAETIASKALGVQKVVDELTLGAQTASAQPGGGSSLADAQAQTQPNLQSDGTMAPAPIAQGSPDSDNTAPQGQQQPLQQAGNAPQPGYGPGGQASPQYRRPYPPQGYNNAPPQGYYGAPQQPVYGGQEAGISVTVPTGAMVRIRINQALDSGHTKPGTPFDGIVVNDVVAGGAVAIPRGAAIQGIVVDAKKSGVLAGRGELSLQLTQVTMGGKTYPIVSDIWAHNGGDKTIQTVNSTAIGGGLGALVGAAAGGGVGAAIGAGVGGALGLGSSAASGGGQVYIPSEGMLSFHLTQPATVATVSQQEMDRLAQGVPPGGQPVQLRRRYPAPYYGPAYYRPGYPYPY